MQQFVPMAGCDALQLRRCVLPTAGGPLAAQPDAKAWSRQRARTAPAARKARPRPGDGNASQHIAAQERYKPT